jgi:aminopeptidase N
VRASGRGEVRAPAILKVPSADEVAMKHAISAALAAALAFSASAQPGQRQVLPASVVPIRYQLTVTPDAATLTMSGEVRIEIEVAEPTRDIVLNALELTLDDVQLEGREQPEIVFDAAAQTVRLRFSEAVATGRHTLALAYRAKIYPTAQALFAYDYVSDHGPERILTTQFEIAEARRFVPSFDQPDMKAVWEIAAVVPAERTAVSNMPEAGVDRVSETLKRVRFAPTPKISSYLLFLGVGDLERIATTVDGVEISVLAKRGDAEHGRFALDSAVQLLRYYNEYFGVRYPLPKLDLIAVPGGGGFSAMENWGAIMYFEEALLLDPALSAETDRQDVFATVAHEMAHQWFGDLVTPKWWDDLWLNEGFAAWMERKAAERFHPDWNTWMQGQRESQEAMGLDARATAHAVSQRIDTTDQANGAFDRITYEKGRAVIRMIEQHVGADRFRDGIRAYVRAHAFGNADSAQLWDAIEAASGKPMRGIAEDFIFRAGVPLITVDPEKCERKQRSVSVMQSRFALDEASRAPLVWHVPVTAEAAGGGTAAAVTDDRGAATFTVRGCGAVVVNPAQAGYYRTYYPRAAFTEVAEGFARLQPADQLGLLYDAHALGIAGLVPYTDVYDLVRRAPAEADPLVLEWIARELGDTDLLYADLPGRDAFRAYARAQLAPQLARVGWDKRRGEAANDAILRERLIAALSQLADPGVDAEAHRRFANGAIPGAVREETLYAVGRAADAATFADLLARARAATDTLELGYLYRALAHARAPALAARALELAFDPAVPFVLGPDMISDVAVLYPQLAWDFAAVHRAELTPRLDPLGALQFVARLGGGGHDAALQRDLRAYIDRDVPADVRSVSESHYLRLSERLMIRAERLPELDSWLRASGG